MDHETISNNILTDEDIVSPTNVIRWRYLGRRLLTSCKWRASLNESDRFKRLVSPTFVAGDKSELKCQIRLRVTSLDHNQNYQLEMNVKFLDLRCTRYRYEVSIYDFYQRKSIWINSDPNPDEMIDLADTDLIFNDIGAEKFLQPDNSFLVTINVVAESVHQDHQTEDSSSVGEVSSRISNSEVTILSDEEEVRAFKYDKKFRHLNKKPLLLSNQVSEELRDLETMFSQGLLSDVTLITEDGQELKTHKSVLASRSSVFRDEILATGDSNSENKVIKVSGVDYEVMREILRFMYIGKVSDLGEEKNMTMLRTAKKYDVKALMPRCEKLLQRYVRIDNVIELLKLSNCCEANRMVEATLNFLVDNIKRVKETELMVLNQELLARILLRVLKKIM